MQHFDKSGEKTGPSWPKRRELAKARERRRAVFRWVPSDARRAELARGQEPFAIILGCSGSRVPAEMVFDQGLGEEYK